MHTIVVKSFSTQNYKEQIRPANSNMYVNYDWTQYAKQESPPPWTQEA